MQPSNQWLRAFGRASKLSSLCLIATLLSACATVSLDSYCVLYEPIYHSNDDTEDTRGQIDRQNAIWLEVCEE